MWLPKGEQRRSGRAALGFWVSFIVEDAMSAFWQLLSPPRQFLDHPDFIAARVRKKYSAHLRRRLHAKGRQRSTLSAARPISEGTAAAAARALAECPLDASWRDWDAMVPPIFSLIPDADRLTCEAARHLTPLRHLGLIRLEWLSATPPTNPDSRMQSRRIHATGDISGRTVHVDWVNNSNQRGGPGRSFAEFRAFVDGQLAGRGGEWGCSLGVGGRDLPLVARISANRAITLDHMGRGLPIVEVWTV
jgi:hypothetical protein